MADDILTPDVLDRATAEWVKERNRQPFTKGNANFNQDMLQDGAMQGRT